MPENSLSVIVDDATIYTTTPYHPDFPNAAKRIGGTFVEKVSAGWESGSSTVATNLNETESAQVRESGRCQHQ